MVHSLSKLSSEVRQYLIVTANYWAFTVTDGALRMLIVLHFHTLGYSPIEIAFLFLFYEVFGVITNLVGGWLGARFGLNKTMNLGLGLQILALGMLLVPDSLLTVLWVMAAQALSGIAKDLNKMSAKSAIKTLLPENADSALFRWVSRLTGSKNALKGLGFFIGGWLLASIGFFNAILTMAGALIVVWLFSIFMLRAELGKSSDKPKFTQLFSRSSSINQLAGARLFLFGARDIWFVVALPVFLSAEIGWPHSAVGSLFAAWIIFYGLIQALVPTLLSRDKEINHAYLTSLWGWLLSLVTAAIALTFYFMPHNTALLIIGLAVFAGFFAVNSALHSYLAVAYADRDQTSMDVGFYYMANALGRLVGTILSGLIYQQYGLLACLIGAVIMTVTASALAKSLPNPSSAL